MKIRLSLLMALSALTSYASIDFAKLEGEWKTNCSQTQMNGISGFVVESYSFSKPDNFNFVRSWHKNSNCLEESFREDKEVGVIEVKSEDSGSIFNPKNTYKAEFTVDSKTDKGLIWLNDKQDELRLSRGFAGGVQNSMLGIIQYKKIKGELND